MKRNQYGIEIMLDIVWDRDDAWQIDKVDDYISGPIQGRVGQNMTGRDR